MVYFAKWKTWVTLVILAAGILFSLPNLLTQEQAEALPSWLPHSRISLGLDLQGGSHLLFQVDIEAVVRERLDSARDALRDVLRKNSITYTGLGVANDAVTAQLSDPTTRNKVLSLVRDTPIGVDVQIDDNGKITGAFSDQELRQLKGQVVDQSIEIVRRRIDLAGVKEPTIIRQGDDRIIVELPGVGDPTRLQELIGKTAKMTFHLVSDAYPNSINKPPQASELPNRTAGLLSIEGGYEVRGTRAILTGENLISADSVSQPTMGQP